MKKAIILSSLVLAFASLAQATITINLLGGNLYDNNTSTLLPTGSLVQLIVSRTPATNFDQPSVGSFTGNSTDDFVLASFVTNAPGQFGTIVNFSLGNGIDTGDQLLLRWYPGLTLASTAPASTNQRFGQFRTDIVQANPDGSDIAWVVPADGFIGFLTFSTVSQGGSNAEALGVANNFVAVPEPSTVALLGLSMAGLVAYSRRRKS